MSTPASGTNEARARIESDRLLSASGWLIQNRGDADITAGWGVAIREFPLKSPHGVADYMLFTSTAATGGVEAKKAGAQPGSLAS